MDVPENSPAPRESPETPLWLVIPIAIVALLGAGWGIVAGVARKEDCSAVVGSLDTGSGLYRPCELVGYLEGVVLVGLAALTVMVILRDAKLRLAVALVAAIAILAIAATGLSGLAI